MNPGFCVEFPLAGYAIIGDIIPGWALLKLKLELWLGMSMFPSPFIFDAKSRGLMASALSAFITELRNLSTFFGLFRSWRSASPVMCERKLEWVWGETCFWISTFYARSETSRVWKFVQISIQNRHEQLVQKLVHVGSLTGNSHTTHVGSQWRCFAGVWHCWGFNSVLAFFNVCSTWLTSRQSSFSWL